MHKSFPKPKTPRDKKYLAFIREQRCMVYNCSDKAEAAHLTTGGMRIKGSDYETGPLCHHHHINELHKGEKTFFKKYPYLNKWREIATYHGKYLVELKEGARKI